MLFSGTGAVLAARIMANQAREDEPEDTREDAEAAEKGEASPAEAEPGVRP
jgi:hypothetical protein